MPCLLDTSAIICLIKSGLLDDALRQFQVAKSTIEILPETFHIAEANQRLPGKAIMSAAQRNQCLEFCRSVGRIKSPWRDDPEEHILLSKKHEIWHEASRVKLDGGEAQIFGYTKTLSDFSVWTADRRCLIALSKWPGCEKIHARMRGKVYCLERIIRELIQGKGFPAIANRIADGHHSLQRALDAGEHGCCAVLRAAEADLQSSCDGLLAP